MCPYITAGDAFLRDFESILTTYVKSCVLCIFHNAAMIYTLIGLASKTNSTVYQMNFNKPCLMFFESIVALCTELSYLDLPRNAFV